MASDDSGLQLTPLMAPSKSKSEAIAAVGLPRVAIIVLNWKGLDDTQACCESLSKLANRQADVFIVDNASGDGSAETLRSEFPQFTHVANQRNLGFGGGNNAQVKRLIADGYKYVLLLNNDTTVAPDFMEAMVNAAEADPKVGMVGAKIYHFNPPNVIWYAGGTVDFEQPEPFRQVGENSVDQGQYGQPGETGWITGCCLLARSETLKQVGLLDEAFGYYCEDVDWCLRAKKAGWKIWHEPRAKVWHKISRSAGRGNLPVCHYMRRNTLLVARNNLNWPKKIGFYVRAIKWIRRLPGDDQDKAGFIEATVHGILGQGGLITETGKAWWSRCLLLFYRKIRGYKNR